MSYSAYWMAEVVVAAKLGVVIFAFMPTGGIIMTITGGAGCACGNFGGIKVAFLDCAI